ncbi:MAG: hypothetical protein AAB372_02615 [Patescibacteria group bacterium]
MKKQLTTIGVLFGVLTVYTVLVINSAVLLGFDAEARARELSSLDDTREELRARYLTVVLEQIAPDAEEAGFVAVYAPTYLDSSDVVAFR